ncbi:MAG: DUF2066 domain-containing protein [Rhodanobacteraceae bacterium]|nr:MAG: DUF2066 domain-containing protein [Rhodanobacteraceae bacterium]
MMRTFLSLLLALSVAVAASAQTASAPAAAPASSAAPTAPASPYSATVPVAGTSDAQRSAAIATALTQVLRQVSPGFAASPDMLSNASGYVRNFHYSRAPSGSGLQLTVDFDPGAVGRLVAQGGSTPSAAGGAATTAGATAASPGTAGSTAGAAASGTATVWVGGIDSTHAYASLLSMLRGDSQLQNVIPIGADHDGLLLQVGYSAPLATVLAALETPNGHLSQAVQPHAGADASLRWTP